MAKYYPDTPARIAKKKRKAQLRAHQFCKASIGLNGRNVCGGRLSLERTIPQTFTHKEAVIFKCANCGGETKVGGRRFAFSSHGNAGAIREL